MATFEITAPDGTKYQITAPDNASHDDVLAYAQKQHAAPSEGGFVSALRSAANAATFNAADPIQAGIGAVLQPVLGSNTPPLSNSLGTPASQADGIAARYRENLSALNGTSQADQANHPVASLAGSVGGGFLNPVTRALPVARTIGGAAAQAGAVGAGYGLGGGISNQDSLPQLAGDTLKGGFGGAMMGAAFHGAGKLVRGATQNPDAALLNANSIPTTIGQDLGGGFKRAEDATTSLPWGGDAIIARQKEGLSGFNRALENNALSPVGLRVPDPIAPGNDAGRYLKTMNDAAYTAAYTGATVQKTPQLVADLQSATDHFPAGLDPSGVQKDIQTRVLGAFDQNGIMDSRAFNDAKNWLSEHSRTTQSMSNDQIDVANAYKSALTALKGQMSNTDPTRGAMLKAADAVYARRMPLIDAAGNTNASMKGGIVTPAQYSRAIDSSDGSAHGLQYSLGGLPQQSMVQAAQRTLPSSIPDSGTAIRRLLTGGLPAAVGASVGAGAVGLPGVAAAGLPMLATRLLYSKKGQELAKAALFGSPTARAQLAQILQQGAPGAYGLLGSAVAP